MDVERVWMGITPNPTSSISVAHHYRNRGASTASQEWPTGSVSLDTRVVRTMKLSRSFPTTTYCAVMSLYDTARLRPVPPDIPHYCPFHQTAHPQHVRYRTTPQYRLVLPARHPTVAARIGVTSCPGTIECRGCVPVVTGLRVCEPFLRESGAIRPGGGVCASVVFGLG